MIGVTENGVHYILRVISARHKLIDWWKARAQEIIRQFGYGIKFYCDSARPDNIEEFRKSNIWAVEANKSINAGVEAVAKKWKKRTLFIVRSQAAEFLSEIYSYIWDAKTGNPVKINDDIMDALRYGVYTDGEDHRYGEK